MFWEKLSAMHIKSSFSSYVDEYTNDSHLPSTALLQMVNATVFVKENSSKRLYIIFTAKHLPFIKIKHLELWGFL